MSRITKEYWERQSLVHSINDTGDHLRETLRKAIRALEKNKSSVALVLIANAHDELTQFLEGVK